MKIFPLVFVGLILLGFLVYEPPRTEEYAFTDDALYTYFDPKEFESNCIDDKYGEGFRVHCFEAFQARVNCSLREAEDFSLCDPEFQLSGQLVSLADVEAARSSDGYSRKKHRFLRYPVSTFMGDESATGTEIASMTAEIEVSDDAVLTVEMRWDETVLDEQRAIKNLKDWVQSLRVEFAPYIP